MWPSCSLSVSLCPVASQKLRSVQRRGNVFRNRLQPPPALPTGLAHARQGWCARFITNQWNSFLFLLAIVFLSGDTASSKKLRSVDALSIPTRMPAGGCSLTPLICRRVLASSRRSQLSFGLGFVKGAWRPRWRGNVRTPRIADMAGRGRGRLTAACRRRARGCAGLEARSWSVVVGWH